ncbi:methyltransferase domain-containing protein [Streptomyces sp. NBC_00342]|uniref:methyltransferase domain-containing protein n=1 Tax=Streptomyces sp. NBC_00342 TaxID=2975718 RepID=UPI002E2D294F|nr:methyltransferase domain-containing protein [Streptomyces sp. NBC_00342]
MDWQQHAARLADQSTEPDSRWLAPVAKTPRHELVPRWWKRNGSNGWQLKDGAADPEAWMKAAYADRSLITRVGTLHADRAEPDDQPHGLPTSSATVPSLVVRMLRHGRLGTGLSFLDLGTGAGGLTAYASMRFGAENVTSLDVDPYLVSAAGNRLAHMGYHPEMVTADATERVPGTYDRIVSTVGLPAGPGLRPVLSALAPGGRIATTIGRTCLIITGWKHANGDVIGRVERDMAGFMLTRSGDDFPPALSELFSLAREGEGAEISTGTYPVLDVAEAWELSSMLQVTTPGVETDYEQRDGIRSAFLAHPDGSWARASAMGTAAPEVHQGGPQRLWTALERIRGRLNSEGSLPLLGAWVLITPDGVCHLSRGKWRASIGNR